MKAFFQDNGMLWIVAENDLEAWALQAWRRIKDAEEVLPKPGFAIDVESYKKLGEET